MYCGRGNHHWALQHERNGHRWSNSRDRDGETLCTKPPNNAREFEWNEYKFVRVKVQGKVNSQSIQRACCEKGMRPVCDHWNYQDGKCRMAGGRWHFSHPSHDRQHGIDAKKLRGVFFYCGHSNHNRALINLGNTHRWTHGWESDGDTMCVTRTEAYKQKHKGDWGKLRPGMVVQLKGGRGRRWCHGGEYARCQSHNPNSGHAHNREFTVVPVRDQCGVESGVFALKRRGKHCADEGHRWRCNRGWTGQWERFQEVKVDNNQFALIGGRHRKFCADEGNRIRCNRNAIGQWERFQMKCVRNCGEEAALELGEAPVQASDEQKEKPMDTIGFSNKHVAPVPWHRYGTSFKWLWPGCPNGDCRKAKPQMEKKEGKFCAAEFYYGIQACGKYPARQVTWTNPVSNKVETSEVGCNCRGQLVKTAFYGSVVSTRDMLEETRKACTTEFNKWSAEIRAKLRKFEPQLEALSEEIGRKCSPTYPVIRKELNHKAEVRKLERKYTDRQASLKAMPPMIQPGFDWLHRPKKTNMPRQYRVGEEVNNGDCQAEYISALSVCKRGTLDSVDSVSFGCGCNGLFLQATNYGVVTGMKDESAKTQAKCARLFAQWSAEQGVHAREDHNRAYDVAPKIAMKCSASHKLAKKADQHGTFSAKIQKLTPKFKTASKKLAELKAGHEQLHKADLRKKAKEKSSKMLEKQMKARGKEVNAKTVERQDKETAHKDLHKAWKSGNSLEEQKNKAQVKANQAEKLLVQDLKARADSMQAQIMKNSKEIDSGVENYSLRKRVKRSKELVSELQEKVKTARSDQKQARDRKSVV